MKGSEIISILRGRSDIQNSFIKWWRRENDFADFELAEEFVNSNVDELEFAGYEVLSIDQMWDLLQQQAADHVDLSQKGGEKLLVWRRSDGETVTRPYTAKTLMEVFDAETRGDVLM